MGYAISTRSCQKALGLWPTSGAETIRKCDHVLTLGRYVGAAEEKGYGVPFEEKFSNLLSKLRAQFAGSAELEDKINAFLPEVTVS